MGAQDERSRVVRVQLSPEWPNQYPVWITLRDDPDPVDTPVEELSERYGVPAQVSIEIGEWDREFQAIYRPDDPRESAFPDEATMHRWYARGRELAERLAAEFGPAVPVEVVRMGGGYVRVGSDIA
jgi:hypothetical protein